MEPMSSLAQILEAAIGERSIQQAADVCGVPQWVLRDVLIGKTRCPRPDYLQAISKGLKIELDKLLAAAYGSNSKEGNGSRTATGGKRRGKATASVS